METANLNNGVNVSDVKSLKYYEKNWIITWKLPKQLFMPVLLPTAVNAAPTKLSRYSNCTDTAPCYRFVT